MSMGASNADAAIPIISQARARASTSIRDPAEAALVATSAAGLIPIAASDAALPAAPQTVTAAEPLEPRERVYASQLRLARSHDEHDPHERVASIHAAMAGADAVALSQRIMRASLVSEPATQTVFDQILKRKIPAFVVYEDDDVLAFHDSAPQAPVHIVIIPKCRDGLTGLAAAEERHKRILGQLLYTASRVARMEEKLRDGYRIVINEGGYGGQTVLHLHLHLLGGRFMEWPPG